MAEIGKKPVCQPQGGALSVRLARDISDLRAAQRLRYQVFVEELGAHGPMVDHFLQLEMDEFDPVFDHLLLIDEHREAADLDHVVGVYRLLPGDRATAAGGFYCDAEFDLTQLRACGRNLLELGRSCMHPAYRGGLGLLQIWHGLAEYVNDKHVDLLFGAASFPGTDPEYWGQSLSCLHHDYLAPEALLVRSRQANGFSPLPSETVDRKLAMAQMPPLIRSYLRLGGRVGQGVFIDREFKTIDVCIILDKAALSLPARNLARAGNTIGPAMR
ncbi:MAG: GNAT family N-acetyltransferase [Rhodobacteraceae bacterium]|nr:MAG: GNAT family N-acetyltransferase [Paracoccaceae bacterium]